MHINSSETVWMLLHLMELSGWQASGSVARQRSTSSPYFKSVHPRKLTPMDKGGDGRSPLIVEALHLHAPALQRCGQLSHSSNTCEAVELLHATLKAPCHTAGLRQVPRRRAGPRRVHKPFFDSRAHQLKREWRRLCRQSFVSAWGAGTDHYSSGTCVSCACPLSEAGVVIDPPQ
jgi:hypothetical protein